MAVIILGIALSVLDGTIVNLALPGIARDLHVSAPQTVWVVNAYQVATLGLLLPCAALGDQIGYRRVYLWGLSLFTVASLGCVLATSLTGLVAARVLQGLGAAGIMAVNSALVKLIYPKRLFGRGVAINSMVVATASVAGPTVAAGNALMFGLVFLGADALGTTVAAGAGLDRLAWPLAMLLAGLAIGAFYVRRQLRLTTPLFPLDLLRIPVFALSMCTSVGAFAAQMLAYISLPFLLLDTYGLSHLKTGALITAWPVAIVVTAPIVGQLIGKIADGLLGGIGLAMLSAGLALLAALPTQPADWDIAWRLALCGAGFAVFQSPNNHTILTSAPANRSGGASGMLGTARLTGQTMGAVLVAIIFTVVDAKSGRGPVVALGLAAVFAAVGGAFSSLRLRHSPAGGLERQP
jgi:DHA2 family multidrug resistance protein-like MFS transporter